MESGARSWISRCCPRSLTVRGSVPAASYLISIRPASRTNPPFAGVTAVFALQEVRSSTCTIVLGTLTKFAVVLEPDKLSDDQWSRALTLFLPENKLWRTVSGILDRDRLALLKISQQ